MLRLLHEPDVSDPVRFLDVLAQSLRSGDGIHLAMDTLSDGLWWIRRSMQPDDWNAFRPVALSHPILSLVHEDPFTRRSFEKPRGYAGDAVLLDYIYYDLGVVPTGSVSDLGKAIFARNKDTPAPTAVRERRDFVANLVDEVCGERADAAILCAACGHLREALKSEAFKEGRFNRFIAADQDPESVAEVAVQYGSMLGVEAVELKMKAFLGNAFPARSFDLIYAAGLYDYLEDRFAERLTARLFDLLRPGGRLVVGNFVPDIYDAGYMETYMGWSLRYRDAGGMRALAASVPPDEVSNILCYTRNSPDIAYLEVRRRRSVAVSLPASRAATA